MKEKTESAMMGIMLFILYLISIVYAVVITAGEVKEYYGLIALFFIWFIIALSPMRRVGFELKR